MNKFISITAVLGILANSVLLSADKKTLIRQYSAPLTAIERTYQCIKTIGMKDFGKPKFSSLSNRVFHFTIKDSNSKITFTNSRLLEFYNELKDPAFFKKLMEAASIYGIDRESSGKSNNKDEQSVGRYQPVVLIIEYNESSSDDTLIFAAGK